jgi:ubiquinone/menaquinone biosynthesis C-methylase UbiE
MLPKFIASQLRKPSGLLGNFVANIMIKGNRKSYINLIRNLDVQPSDKLLEIGYGPGLGIHMITQLCNSCIVHGVDFSRLMHKKASRYNKLTVEKGKVQLQYGDFLEIPLTKNQYDKIYCLNVIYFWDDLTKPFAKTLSLLKETGAFFIYMVDANFLVQKKAPDSVFNKYSIEQVLEALGSAGFNNIEHYFNKGYYIKAKKY